MDTSDAIAAMFPMFFSVQPTRVREMKTQHVLSINHQLEKWNNEMLATMQRYYQRMMSENIMKQGKAGALEELGKIREMILNPFNHPNC